MFPLSSLNIFLLLSLMRQTGSAKWRACNRDTHHFWHGAPTLRRPHVIHKHDRLAALFLHLQCKWRERKPRGSDSVGCPFGVVPEWMGKEEDEKEIWSRKGGEGAFLYRPGWTSSMAGWKPSTKCHLRSDASLPFLVLQTTHQLSQMRCFE